MVSGTKIKMFEHRKHSIIFDGKDMTLKLLPLNRSNSIDRIGHKISQKTIDIQPICLNIQKNTEDEIELHPEQKIGRKPDMNNLPPIDRLTLNVSNICNMKCKYCYAVEGIYYTPGILMDRKTALNAINYAFRNFSEIRLVNFFGGEPTLNKPIVELICEYIIYLHNRGILKRLPKFALTTNGYEIDSLMFEIIDAYGFRVSVSLDGPKEIHDRLRINKSQKGTYDAIEKNVKVLIDMGIELEFECTYTNEHHQCGIDLLSLMDFFHDNFQSNVLHCPMVVARPDSPWFIPYEASAELYGDAIRYSINNLIHNEPKLISIAARFLNSMSTKSPICHYCPAGKSTITINADGNIYTCFMLMHGQGFCMGNVNDETNINYKPHLINALIDDTDKQQNPACQKCWAQTLCFGCIGDDFKRKGHKITRSEVPGQSDLCDYKRCLIKIFLKSIADSHFLAAAKDKGKNIEE